MAETPYRSLSADDRRDALRVAETRSPHRAFLLEKDIWVVATLDALFEAPFGKGPRLQGRNLAVEGVRGDPRDSSRSVNNVNVL